MPKQTLESFINDLYLDAQKSCDINVGDTVIIKQGPQDFDKFWAYSWHPYLNEFVGKDDPLPVVGIEDYGILVSLPDGAEPAYPVPYFCLSKVAK